MKDINRFGPKCAAIIAAADLARRASERIVVRDFGSSLLAHRARRHALNASLVAYALRAALEGRDFSPAYEHLRVLGTSPEDVLEVARDGLAFAAQRRAEERAAA